MSINRLLLEFVNHACKHLNKIFEDDDIQV